MMQSDLPGWQGVDEALCVDEGLWQQTRRAMKLAWRIQAKALSQLADEAEAFCRGVR